MEEQLRDELRAMRARAESAEVALDRAARYVDETARAIGEQLKELARIIRTRKVPGSWDADRDRQDAIRKIAARAKLGDAWADETIAAGVSVDDLRRFVLGVGCGEPRGRPAPTAIPGDGEPIR